MAYVHSTIVYSLEAPAGWLQSTSRTTVRAVTIKNAAGQAVTRAAVTATTTTTTVAARSGSAENSSTGKASGPPRLRRNIISSMWGHLSQHSAVHAAQVVAATAKVTLPEGRAQGEIELQPQRVAQVVQKAKAAEELQQVAQQGAATEPTTAAEKYAGLYGAGGAGSVVLKPTSDLSSCPDGTAAPQGATALILLADSNSGPAVLKRSLDGLMLLYSQASADIRAAFHLYIGLDGDNAEMEQLAHQYAVDSLGTVKLVHHKTSSTVGGTSSTTDSTAHTASSSSGSDSASSSQLEKAGGDRLPAGTAPSSTTRADHVRLLLHVFLQCFQYPSVLLLEDDWKLLPDFFEYFDATQWLLGSDTSVYCISAWNPLGQQQHLQQHSSRMTRVHRVDTNPGRGWLLGKATGLQLLKTWPREQTLDWQQHIHSMGLQYGQQCVVPDVSRMVPAAVHDTADAAHIVAATDAAADAASTTAEGEALLPAHEADSSSSSSTAASIAGAVDQEAANAPEVAWATAAEAAGKGSAVAASVDTARQDQGEVHGQPRQSAWPGRDMSYLMAPGYKKWIHQRLLAAKPVDVATAVMLTDKKRAARLAYGTAAELSAAAEALGVPLTLTQGVRYCYSLPTTPATQHCQDYLPDMAYEGVVTARTQLGVRVYFVHLAYINALQDAGKHAGSVAAQATGAGATGTATAR